MKYKFSFDVLSFLISSSSSLHQIILKIRKEYKTSFYAQLYFCRRGKTVVDFLLCPTAENIIVLHLPNDVKTLIYAGSESS